MENGMTAITGFSKKVYSELVFTSIMFLFFIQLFSDFIESTYLLVLMTLSLNQNLLVLFFLFSPITLLFFRRNIPNNLLPVLGIVMIGCRVLEPLFETTARMIISGFGVGCFMIFLPVYLLTVNTDNEEQHGLTIGLGLMIAVASSVFLRTLGLTIDLSTYGWGQGIGWVLAVIGLLMIIGFYESRTLQGPSTHYDEISSPEPIKTPQPVGIRYVLGIALGLTSILFFISFAFSSPVVISRWTETNYLIITAIVVLMVGLSAVLLLHKPDIISKLSPRMLWIWNAVFILAFVLTAVVNQIYFPGIPDSYPIEAPATTLLHYIPLVIMLATFPVILFDFIFLSRGIMNCNYKLKVSTISIGFTLGSGLYMVIMIFSLVFTSVWGFIPVIGVLFRDLFWLVFLGIGLVVMVSLRRVSESTLSFLESKKQPKTKTIVAGVMVVLFLGTMVSGIALEANPVPLAEPVTSVRFLTYNLQQGVSDAQNKNYDGQLEIIRSIDADVIGLQETSKIAGCSDVVRYIANNLNYYSYFGPKGVTGTTGVALLSRYPIENPRTIFHFSENVDRKQTATIEAEIIVGSYTFTVYVTHTYGRTSTKSILQTDVLNEASGKNNVVFLGDFNFRPNSDPYNLTTDVLDDSWWLKWTTGTDDQGDNNSRRIDHIFVSPGTEISDCQYEYDPQSDHPAYWADIQLQSLLQNELAESHSPLMYSFQEKKLNENDENP